MNNSRDKQLWWQPAMLMFANISGWIVGPIILALVIGKYLDRKYNSEPWFFLGLTGLAFLVSIFGILKIMMKYIKEIEKEAREKRELDKSKENINN